MNTERPTKPLQDDLDEASIVEFLRQHPDFFEHHPQLLAFIKLNHQTGGNTATVSLIERQVAVLREQNRNLECKLMELVKIARDNERVSQQLHAFAAELLKVSTLSDIVAVSEDKIRELFDTEYVSLRLLPEITDDPTLRLEHAAQKELFREMSAQDKPLCGRLRLEQLQTLFRGNAKSIASAAAVPLKATKSMGVLGLGSSNRDLISSAIAVRHG